MLAVGLVRDMGAVILNDSGLDLACKSSTWKTSDPMEPLFFAIAHATALQKLEPTAEPLLVGCSLVLEFVDRRTAEHEEHVVRMAST